MLLERWPAPVRRALFAVLGIESASRILTRIDQRTDNLHDFLSELFARNDFDVQLFNEDKLPRDGGCIIAFNHPHGFFDGLAGIWLAGKFGHDARAIARHFLTVFEPIRDLFLLIKIDANRKSATGEQIAEQAAAFVRNGGRLAVTAAGRLSLARPFWRKSVDLPWKTGTVRIAQQAQAPIVLVHMAMRESGFRQLCQRVHPVVRALAQTWAFLLGRTQKIHMTVLAVIEPGDLPPGSVQEQTLWLRQRYDALVAQL